MALGLHVFEDVGELAVGPDEERGARDPHHLPAVHVLLFQDAELLGDLFLVVGQQGIRQTVFFFKLQLCLRRVG